MAKKSKIAKTKMWNARALMSAKKREEARVGLNSGDVSQLMYLVKKRSRSISRIKNRCKITFRPRAYIGDFGMSRCLVRHLASFGFLPGVKKV